MPSRTQGRRDASIGQGQCIYTYRECPTRQSRAKGRYVPFAEYVPAQRRDGFLTRISEARSAVPRHHGLVLVPGRIQFAGSGLHVK